MLTTCPELINAIQEKNIALIEEFASSGNTELANETDDKCKCPLHHAVESGDNQIVSLLCPVTTALLEIYNEDGMNCIHTAIMKCDVNMVNIMLKTTSQNAINTKTKGGVYSGYTPLHLCCLNNKSLSSTPATCLRWLLRTKADINAVTDDGDNALHICARHNSVKQAKLLIQYGVKINHANKVGATPLMVACAVGSLEIVELLLDKDFLEESGCMQTLYINHTDNMNDNALHFALQSQLQRLFPDGAEISAKNEKIAFMLCQKGININQRSIDGHSPFDYISPAFEAILRHVNQYPNSYHRDLEVLVLTPDYLLLSNPSHIDPQKRVAFAEAVQKYREERAQEDLEASRKGGCPFASGNKRRRRGAEPTKQNTNKTVESQTPKCPLGFTGDSKPDHIKNASKCPIPYHQHLKFLKQSSFWLACLFMLIAGVLLARVMNRI